MNENGLKRTHASNWIRQLTHSEETLNLPAATGSLERHPVSLLVAPTILSPGVRLALLTKDSPIYPRSILRDLVLVLVLLPLLVVLASGSSPDRTTIGSPSPHAAGTSPKGLATMLLLKCLLLQ